MSKKTAGQKLSDYFNRWKKDPAGMAMSKEGAIVGGTAVAGFLFLPWWPLAVAAAALATEPGRQAVLEGFSEGSKNRLEGPKDDDRPRIDGPK